MSEIEAVDTIQKTFNVNRFYAKTVYKLTKTTDFMSEAALIIKQKPKPFVKWVGGKRQLLGQFRDLGLYPPENFDFGKATYFEPFLGGGAVFFDLLPKKALLSDLNKELVITYNVIKNDVDNLIKALKKHKYEKTYFLKIRELDTSKLSDLQIASRFIYLNRTCFNGLYRVNKSGKFNVPFGKYSNPVICDETNLRSVSYALQNVLITYNDYKTAVKRAKKGDFIYFDPPYYPLSKTASFTSYTSESFLDKEQIELRDLFEELHKRGCYVMLSNSNSPFIRKIYSEIKGVKINIITASRAINSKAKDRGKITEVLITNY